MRAFLLTLTASILASVVLWNLGLAHRIWPAHPYFATLAIATTFGIVVQSIASAEAQRKRARRRDQPV
jgi:hypothetical protein